MDAPAIKVQMLGDFVVSYNGMAAKLERSSATKATQLLQYLLFHEGSFVPREQLAEVLYGFEEDVVDPQNNLKVNIFRLRRLLASSPLPEGDYIVNRGGGYAWQSAARLELDVRVFERAMDAAADFRCGVAERKARMEKALALYTGELLPMVASTPWVLQESVRLTGIYLSCVRELCGLYEADGENESALAVCERALPLYPYEEELHLTRISALLNLRLYHEALAAYDEAARRFLEELGVSPSERMLGVYRRITGNVQNSAALIDDVKADMRRSEPPSGAYYCNFPGFADSYLFVSRMVERSGQSMYLVLSTLTDTPGVPLELGERLTQAADALKTAIHDTLRQSDLYSRYSPSQFILLLVGITREDCALVAERITERFRESCALRGVRLRHSFTSGIDPGFRDEQRLSFRQNPWREHE